MKTESPPKSLAITWFADSPDAGPGCCCSLCGDPIIDVPIRMWSLDGELMTADDEPDEARFHATCFTRISYAFTGVGRERQSIIPNTYIVVNGMGLPLRWQDDLSGQLPAAIKAFLSWKPGMAPLDSRLLRLVIDYLVHYIDAPCWNGNFVPEMANLRLRAGQLETAQDVRDWLADCLDIALDPL